MTFNNEMLRAERDAARNETRSYLADLKEYATLLGIDTSCEGDEPGQLQVLHAIQALLARAVAAEARVEAMEKAATALLLHIDRASLMESNDWSPISNHARSLRTALSRAKAGGAA